MIGRLARSIREYKKDSILTGVYIALEVFMEILIPIMMAKIIDIGFENNDIAYIVKTGIIMIMMAFCALYCGMKAAKISANASAGFAKNLRKDMFKNIQKFSFQNIDKYSTPSIITRLTTDVVNIQNAYIMIIRTLVRAPLMLSISLILSFFINRRLALIFVCAIPILMVAFYLITINAHPLFVKVFEEYDNLNQIAQENINSMRVVKSFVKEDFEANKYKRESEEIKNNFIKAEKIIAFNAPAMQFTIYTAMIFVSYFGSKLIISEYLKTGELLSLITYMMLILTSLLMIAQVFTLVIIAKSSSERVVEILEEKATLTNTSENPITEIKDSSIEFKNVNFSYNGKINNLTNINLTINSGETIGILGGTGSGKTSIVQLIPRLYDTTSGEVFVGGINVKEYDLESLRNQVAMVLQKNVLFSGTIKENLRWGNENATDEELIEACKLAQADSFIKEFPNQYDTYIERGGSNVSGGQKQRLCIARALLKKPKILILDDSTSAVDTKTDALIQAAFKEYIPETTKIIIAQRISSIEKADKIIVFDDGKIMGIGTHEELLVSNNIYREIYESQVKGQGNEE